MAKYNGHESWEAWNVSLWIANEEGLYRAALRALANAKRDAGKGSRCFVSLYTRAAEALCEELPAETPDGAPFSPRLVAKAIRNLVA